MNLKKFLYIGLATLTIGSLTACGGDTETVSTEDTKVVKEDIKEEVKVVKEEIEPIKETEEKEETKVEDIKEEVEVVEKVRDLRGREVTLANWANVLEPEEKKSSQEEALWEYRNEMMETHNFTFAEVGVTSWDGTLEYFSSNTLSGDPTDDIYRIHSAFISGALNSGLGYDLSTLDSIDLDDPKWSPLAIEYMTKDGGVYGIAKTQRPSFGIFFNKRIFEEAGLEPDLLYDLQASGEWTWDKFVEISELVTRDTDNNGINDVYAIPYTGHMFQYAAMSNGGSYIGRDENGMLFNNVMSPESFEAIQWAANYLAQDYEVMTTQNMGHTQTFMDGQTAMYIAGEAVCVNLAKGMEDDYGFVFFPKGPKATNYVTSNSPSMWMIPSCYTKEEAEDVAFALDIWASQPPEYSGPDDWMAELYPLYRDERAVEETIAMMRQKEHIALDYSNFISGNVKVADYTNGVYFSGQVPAEALEAVSGVWQAEIDRVNALNK